MSDLLDLHTLSDPTDRHSLDELRAHPVPLADSGDVVDLDTPLTEAEWDIVHREMERGETLLREWNAENARLANEKASGGDGR